MRPDQARFDQATADQAMTPDSMRLDRTKPDQTKPDQMTPPDIRALLPHAGQMVLLERLVGVDAQGLCAEVRIGPASLFHGGGGVGAWVGIEYMAQAIAAYAGYAALGRGEAVKVGFLLGARRYEASVPCFPDGSVLHVHVQPVMQGDNGLGAFECRIDAIGAASVASGESDVPAACGGSDPCAESGATVATVARATLTVFQPKNVNDFLDGSLNEGVV